MSAKMGLHERLVALQPLKELRRKASKARTKSNLWTTEELDLAKREGTILADQLKEMME